MSDPDRSETAAPAIRPADDPAAIADATVVLLGGGLVAFPTETVYGLGADATNPAALAALYAAKGRPAENPLILHLAEASMLARVARLDGPLASLAEALAARFWPGPLTLVLPARPEASDPLARAGRATVAARAPDHPAAQALLRAVDRPIAAPSANPSGRLSPTDAGAVAAGLGDRVDLILDGGPCPVGVESTILALTGDAPRLLRPGGVPVEALQTVIDAPLGGSPTISKSAPQSPGLYASHYAPGAGLRLNATAPRAGEAWLGFGPDPAGVEAAARDTLSAHGDPNEAAHRLFAALRRLDIALGGQGVIAVASVPDAGLGLAVNDRLRRAAAPRD